MKHTPIRLHVTQRVSYFSAHRYVSGQIRRDFERRSIITPKMQFVRRLAHSFDDFLNVSVGLEIDRDWMLSEEYL